MKIFISWSGELSCKIAEVLKKWIPCIIQSVEVFFSPDDIEKGDNWDKTISSKLSECSYGIICLTTDNTTAPWINFEAGAIAKSLDSRVTALMVNIKPSDIKGPLSRYQATKFEKNDFFQLIQSINNALETPLDNKILENTFNAMWNSLEDEANIIISSFAQNTKAEDRKYVDNKVNESNILEEILQLLRKQNTMLTDPSQLLPPDYMKKIQATIYYGNREAYAKNEIILEELFRVLEKCIYNMQNFPDHDVIKRICEIISFDSIFTIVLNNIGLLQNKHLRMGYRELYDQYKKIYYDQID